MRPRLPLLIVPLLALMALAAGCGNYPGRPGSVYDDDEVIVDYDEDIGPDGVIVGGYCRVDRECEDICLRSDRFPGVCSLRCGSDADCPIGTDCVEHEGGICAVSCNRSNECYDFGGSFRCEELKRERGGGKALVCQSK